MFGVYNSVDGESSGRHRERWTSPKDCSDHQPVPRRANSDGHHRYFARAADSAAAATRRKAAPVERKLECTLEELCKGCRKEIRFTREVLDRSTGYAPTSCGGHYFAHSAPNLVTGSSAGRRRDDGFSPPVFFSFDGDLGKHVQEANKSVRRPRI